MSLGNAVMHVVAGFKERLHWHHQSDISGEQNLLLEERRKERIRVAGELHDTLLQAFIGASMQLCLADDWVPADSPAKPMLRRALDLVRKGINEGRATLLGLRSPVLASGSLEKALCDVRDEFAPCERTQFRLIVLGETRAVEPAVQEEIFWTAREALINAFRHSKAGNVEIEIEYLPRKLRVVVRDNGAGINPQTLPSDTSSHWGLRGMRHRAESIGAEVRVWSRQGMGTEVEVSVPMRERSGRFSA